VGVVESVPSDWERRHWDLRAFVGRVNRLKLRHPLLQGEGVLRAPGGLDGDVLVLERRAGDEEADAPAGWILVNHGDGPREVDLADLAPGAAGWAEHRLFRVCRDDAPEAGETTPPRVRLDRAEVAYVLPAVPAADA
jgi:hypothetical protein